MELYLECKGQISRDKVMATSDPPVEVKDTAENGMDQTPAISPEKEALIKKIIELQSTLQDLSQRVSSVKEENSRLKAENQVLNQYIDNLMVTSGIFKPTKWRGYHHLMTVEVLVGTNLEKWQRFEDKRRLTTFKNKNCSWH